MRIFVSYSMQDKKIVMRIVDQLISDGHEVWFDSFQIRPGDNIQRKIDEGLGAAQALIVVVSENSFKSQWVQREFAAIALDDISKRERRIIPVRIDKSPVPSYLADRQYLDLSDDFDAGLTRLSAALLPEVACPTEVKNQGTAETGNHESQIQNLRRALRRGRLTLVCGAGASIQAGIPSWNDLLLTLLERMMERIAKNHDLDLGKRAAKEFQNRNGSSSLILGKYLKNNLGNDFPFEMRDALYGSDPKTSELIESIVALSRPQREGDPLDSIITFNFDCLVEDNLSKSGISNKAIFSEAISHDSNEIPIYHVHGFLPRTGELPGGVELVFSEDAYHSQFIDPFSWSNLMQLNKLTQNTCLFIGISLTDPNMRRLLDVAWRKNPAKTLSHYIIKRRPQSSGGDVLDEVSILLEEQDANALGLNVIWLNEFSEAPAILLKIANDN